MTIAICICICFAIFALVQAQSTRKGGFQPTDFIITSSFGGRNPAVYDQTLTFKHLLDDAFSVGQYPTAYDVAVSSSGLAALIGQGGPSAERLRVYRANGTIACSVDFQFGAPLDVAATGAFAYVPGVGVQERDLRDCSLVRTLAQNSTVSGCDVSTTRLFAGVGGGNVEVFDLATGALLTTFVADSGQRYAGAIDFSASTNTILIGDSIANRIFERNASNGQLVRFFDGDWDDSRGMPERLLGPEGITRGPNNTVYVCDRVANIVRVYSSTAQLLTAGNAKKMMGLWVGYAHSRLGKSNVTIRF